MTYSDEIKKIRQKCFLSQEAFGRELGVLFPQSIVGKVEKASLTYQL